MVDNIWAQKKKHSLVPLCCIINCKVIDSIKDGTFFFSSKRSDGGAIQALTIAAYQLSQWAASVFYSDFIELHTKTNQESYVWSSKTSFQKNHVLNDINILRAQGDWATLTFTLQPSRPSDTTWKETGEWMHNSNSQLWPALCQLLV